MNTDDDRRRLLKAGLGAACAAALPVSLVEIAHGGTAGSFVFAFIADSHITSRGGGKFVRDWDRGLRLAVAQTNLLSPKPDFVIYGGDLAQLGLAEEIDHGMELMSALHCKTWYVLGEHDFYADLGHAWTRLTGCQPWYSFDHKGVHFVVLNSVLTFPDWMADRRWNNGMERMLQMAQLDNPNGAPFMVGVEQRAWLRRDLADIDHATPIVVISHSPLQKIHRGWNIWTEDAGLVHDILRPYNRVSVLYGHVHRIQHNRIGNINFNSVMATAWSLPSPGLDVRKASLLPRLNVDMNRAAADATGWQFINVDTGNVELVYQRYRDVAPPLLMNASTGSDSDRSEVPIA